MLLIAFDRCTRRSIVRAPMGGKRALFGATLAFVSTATVVPSLADPVSLSQDQEAAVHQAVLAILKDPTSAQFGPLAAATQSSSETLVCGTVNSKNSFGGYGGVTPFMGSLYDDGNYFLKDFGDNPAGAANVIARCDVAGAGLTP